MPAFKKVSKGVQVTKCDDEVIEKICSYLRIGAFVETAVVMAGVGKETFYKWIKASHKEDHPDFKPIYATLRHAVDRACEEATIRDLLNIDKCAMGQDWEYERHPEGTKDDNGRDISGHLMLNSRGNPIPKKIGMAADWSASAWRLERRKPKNWGSIQKLEHSGDVPAGPQIVVTLPSNGREVKKPGND